MNDNKAKMQYLNTNGIDAHCEMYECNFIFWIEVQFFVALWVFKCVYVRISMYVYTYK